MAHVSVYVFGSFVSGKAESNDIDLLLVHEDISIDSCALAIRCKRAFARRIKTTHVTVLSRNEEQDLDFVEKAKARPIGAIEHDCLEKDIEMISRRLIAPFEMPE